MSLSSALEFLNKAATNPTLSEKIWAAHAGHPLDDIFATTTKVGWEEGFDFTPEEMEQVFERCKEPQPLSDEQLEQVTGAGDFGSLPPELNSVGMFTGGASAPLFQAGSAWEGLAADLSAAASNFQNSIGSLTSGAWAGPIGTTTAGAFAGWLSSVAGSFPGQ